MQQKIIIIGTALFAIMLSIGYYLYNQNNNLSSIEAIKKAENNMIKDSTVLAISLSTTNFMNLLDNNAFADIKAKIPVDKFSEIISNTTHIIATLDNKSDYSFVLIGNYKKPSYIIFEAQEKLADFKQLEENLFSFSLKNKSNCKITYDIAANITKNRIIIAPKKNIKQVTAELDTTVTKNNKKLNKWNSFATNKSQIFKLVNFEPKETKDTILNNSFTEMFSSIVPLEINSISIAMQELEGEFVINHEIDIDKQEFSKKLFDKFNEIKTVFLQENKPIFPILNKIANATDISLDTNKITFTTKLNKNGFPNFKTSVQEAVRALTYKDEEDDNGNVAEIIVDENKIPEFFDNYTHQNLTDFQNGKHHKIIADEFAGTFGISVDRFYLKKTDDGLQIPVISLKLETEPIYNLPIDIINIGDMKDIASFEVSEILNKDKKSLMIKDSCGENKNQDAIALQIKKNYVFKDNKTIEYYYLAGTKDIELVAGVDIDSIDIIKGKVKLTLPININKKRIIAPLAGKTISAKNMQLVFTSKSKNRLNYEIAGKTNNILNIQAINDNGDYLKTISASAANNLFFDNIRSVRKEIAGKIAGVEVIYGNDTISQEYPFEIKKFWENSKVNNTPVKISRVKSETIANFSKYAQIYAVYDFSKFCPKKSIARVIAPFFMCLNNINNLGGNLGASINLSIAGPASPALYNNIFGTEIRIKELLATKGDKIIRIPFLMREFVDFKKIKLKQANLDILQKQYISFNRKDEKRILNDKDIIGIKGQLVVRLPRTLKARGMYANKLGSNIVTKNKELAILVTEITKDYIVLEVAGNSYKLVQIIAMDKNKKPIKLKKTEINKDGAIYKVKITTLNNKVKFLNIVYAPKQEKFAIPFKIKQQ